MKRLKRLMTSKKFSMRILVAALVLSLLAPACVFADVNEPTGSEAIGQTEAAEPAATPGDQAEPSEPAEPTEPTPAPVPAKPGKVKSLKQCDKQLCEITIKWTKSKDATSYRVYRSSKKNGLYRRVATVKTNKYVKKGLKPGKTYYYKIRAVNEAGCGEFCKPVYCKVPVVINAKLTPVLNPSGKRLNYRIDAHQKNGRYDTMQGCCAGDGFIYATLLNKRNNKSKIIKIRISTGKVVRVSKPLDINHANGMTYNERTKNIVVACSGTAPDTLKVINSKTLAIKSTKKLKTRINSIAYNKKKNAYVGRVWKTHKFLRISKNFRTGRQVRIDHTNSMLYQDLDSYGNYVYDVQAFTSGHLYNRIVVRTWGGKFKGVIKVPMGNDFNEELESVFHDGKDFYLGTYSSYLMVDDDGRIMLDKRRVVNRLYKIENVIH